MMLETRPAYEADLLALLCVMFYLCFCHFLIWCPGSGVVLDWYRFLNFAFFLTLTLIASPSDKGSGESVHMRRLT